MDSRETDLNFDDRETGLMSANNIIFCILKGYIITVGGSLPKRQVFITADEALKAKTRPVDMQIAFWNISLAIYSIAVFDKNAACFAVGQASS